MKYVLLASLVDAVGKSVLPLSALRQMVNYLSGVLCLIVHFLDYFNGQCSTGYVYSECGTACPKSCFNHNITVICIEICVSGCFCPNGLVGYRERCVDPLECPVLLQCKLYHA